MSSSAPLRLEMLPDDILVMIFLHLYQRDMRSVSYVCKSLRDVSRPTRFRDVGLKSQAAFHKLCDLFRKHDFAYCAPFVQQMSLITLKSLSLSFPDLFPSLAGLSAYCRGDVDGKFLDSLGAIATLPSRSLDLNVAHIGVSNSSSSKYSSLALTSLSIVVREPFGKSDMAFIQDVLSGATRKSIVTLTIRTPSVLQPHQDTLDPFLKSTKAYPSLQRLQLSGNSLKPAFSRFPVLFPALTSFHSSTLSEIPLHDGNAGYWESLEDLTVTYRPMRTQIDERIFSRAPRMKNVDLCGLSTDPTLQVFRNIASATANALRLRSVSVEMMLVAVEETLKEDILTDAFRAMKNLEHFVLVGYEHRKSHNLSPCQWFTSDCHFASMLSYTTSLRTLRTNMNLRLNSSKDMFPDGAEEVYSFAQSNQKTYMDVTKSFAMECPSLELVTWGFGKGARRWWHVPIKRNESGNLNIDDQTINISRQDSLTRDGDVHLLA